MKRPTNDRTIDEITERLSDDSLNSVRTRYSHINVKLDSQMISARGSYEDKLAVTMPAIRANPRKLLSDNVPTQPDIVTGTPEVVVESIE